MTNVFRFSEYSSVVEIELGERDVVVIETDSRLSEEQRERIRGEWGWLIENQRVIVLDSGMRVKVLRNIRREPVPGAAPDRG